MVKLYNYDNFSSLVELSSLPSSFHVSKNLSVTKIVTDHGIIPNANQFDRLNISKIAVGFLQRSLLSFLEAYYNAGIVDDNQNLEIEYEHLLRIVIIPTLIELGINDENEKTENSLWAVHICIHLLKHAGWNVDCKVPYKDKFIHIRAVFPTMVRRRVGRNNASTYSQIGTAAVTMSFTYMTITLTKSQT